MALKDMGVTMQTVGGQDEILWHSGFTGEALTLDTTAFKDGVCLAGTPVKRDGTKAVTAGGAGKSDSATADVWGILLHDVYENAPQGTALVRADINTAVAEAHSGVTYSEEIKGNIALKGIHFF